MPEITIPYIYILIVMIRAHSNMLAYDFATVSLKVLRKP